MNETQTLLAETCARLFGDLVTPDLLRAAEAGDWPAGLWSALEENGLTRPLVPEDQGGVGMTWQDIFPVLHAAGYYAAPVPLAETIVASWQLAQSGMPVPDGVITLADDQTSLNLAGGDGAWRVSGRLKQVPWAGSAQHILAVAKHDQQRTWPAPPRARGPRSRPPRLDKLEVLSTPARPGLLFVVLGVKSEKVEAPSYDTLRSAAAPAGLRPLLFAGHRSCRLGIVVTVGVVTVGVGVVALGGAGLDPGVYLAFQPTDAIGAKDDPLGKTASSVACSVSAKASCDDCAISTPMASPTHTV